MAERSGVQWRRGWGGRRGGKAIILPFSRYQAKSETTGSIVRQLAHSASLKNSETRELVARFWVPGKEGETAGLHGHFPGLQGCMRPFLSQEFQEMCTPYSCVHRLEHNRGIGSIDSLAPAIPWRGQAWTAPLLSDPEYHSSMY